MHLLKPLLLLLVISAQQAKEGRKEPGSVCFSRSPFQRAKLPGKKERGGLIPPHLARLGFAGKKRVKGFSIERRIF